MRRLRAILESARGIKPTDVSEAAKKARVAEYADFDGIRFMAKIGVEPARGDYKAKNILGEVITPDRKEWHPISAGGQAGESDGSSRQRDTDRKAGVGAVMTGRTKFRVRPLSLSAIEDIWLRRATAVAIEQARAVVTGGAVPPNTPIGRLSDVEWGWIVAAVLFGWISTRAEQATSSGIGVEESIRTVISIRIRGTPARSRRSFPSSPLPTSTGTSRSPSSRATR